MEEKKSTYRGSSAAQRKAVAKYQSEKVEDIRIHVPKGRKDYYKAAADLAGQSLNAFAVNAMDEKIERDNLSIEKPV